jgi:hypothetical protein
LVNRTSMLCYCTVFLTTTNRPPLYTFNPESVPDILSFQWWFKTSNTHTYNIHNNLCYFLYYTHALNNFFSTFFSLFINVCVFFSEKYTSFSRAVYSMRPLAAILITNYYNSHTACLLLLYWPSCLPIQHTLTVLAV